MSFTIQPGSSTGTIGEFQEAFTNIGQQAKTAYQEALAKAGANTTDILETFNVQEKMGTFTTLVALGSNAISGVKKAADEANQQVGR